MFTFKMKYRIDNYNLIIDYSNGDIYNDDFAKSPKHPKPSLGDKLKEISDYYKCYPNVKKNT